MCGCKSSLELFRFQQCILFTQHLKCPYIHHKHLIKYIFLLILLEDECLSRTFDVQLRSLKMKLRTLILGVCGFHYLTLMVYWLENYHIPNALVTRLLRAIDLKAKDAIFT